MFGEKLKYSRKAAGLTLEQLADLYNERFDGGLSKGTLSKYENNKQEPMINVVINLADILNISLDFLLDRSDGSASELIPIDDMTFVKIPVIGRVAAGMGCLADNNVIGYEYVDAKDIHDGVDYRYLRVVGDSMYPKFEEDDLVLVRCQDSVDSGSYAVVIVDNEDGMIKRVVYGPDWIELQSINPMYPIRRFEGMDVLRIRILGVVVSIKRTV